MTGLTTKTQREVKILSAIGDKKDEDVQLHAVQEGDHIMNNVLKISLISAGGIVATALVSGISYVKGKKDGYLLASKKFEGQLNASSERAPAHPQA